MDLYAPMSGWPPRHRDGTDYLVICLYKVTYPKRFAFERLAEVSLGRVRIETEDANYVLMVQQGYQIVETKDGLMVKSS